MENIIEFTNLIQFKENIEQDQSIQQPYYKLPHILANNWEKQKLILIQIQQLYKQSSSEVKKISTEAQKSELISLLSCLDKQSFGQKLLTLKFFLNKCNNNQFYITKLLPWMAQKALEIEKLRSFPILIRQKENEITFSKYAILIILANMFFQTVLQQTQFYQNLQMHDDINFCNIINNDNDENQAKLTCVLQYFTRLYIQIQTNQKEVIDQKITYIRRKFNEKKFLINNNEYLESQLMSNLEFKDQKLIEDFGTGFHIDFANEYIGGGALSYGNVQEEIMFNTNPELFPSMLFCEKMDDNEAIFIIGAQRYSQYTGYGYSFTYEKPYQCDLKYDSMNRKLIAHSAIDAICFMEGSNQEQFTNKCIKREIIKAVAGFDAEGIVENDWNQNRWKIITGNWGCGAFSGNCQLKFILQWIAASLVKREIIYCSFKKEELIQDIDINKIIKLIKGQKVSLIINILDSYYQKLKKNKKVESLFLFIAEFFKNLKSN